MDNEEFFEFVKIDELLITPKYIQLTNGILRAIEAEVIGLNAMLPSINELSNTLDISRDTAEKGYKHLKKIGILSSVPGKGYYVSSVNVSKTLNVVLFFNKLSAHKKIIYDAFMEEIGENVSVDLYVYNNDSVLFKKMLNNPRREYSHYVIIPHFIDGKDSAVQLINELDKEKLVLLDKKIEGIKGEYAAVYENFSQDIYLALEQAKEQLSKYHTLKLIFPDKSYYPRDIIKGFYRFCQEYAFNHWLVSEIEEEHISAGELYINLMEDDLVKVLDCIDALNFVVGKDVGVISYNETPLKRFILKGITTISTDFKYMGAAAARMIRENSKAHVEVPFYLNMRPSV